MIKKNIPSESKGILAGASRRLKMNKEKRPKRRKNKSRMNLNNYMKRRNKLILLKALLHLRISISTSKMESL